MHHSMCLRIFWDKLAARRGKREVILQQLTLSSTFRKKPDEILLEKMQSNEDEEIEKLELELEKQQQSECNRHSRVLEEKRSTVKLSIEMATPMIGTSGSFGSSTSDDNENGSGRGGNDRITLNTTNDEADGNESTPPANDYLHGMQFDAI